GPPRRSVYRLQLFKFFLAQVEALPFYVFVVGIPAYRRFLGLGTTVHPIHNPLEHAHVVAETRPYKIAVGIFSEPIHMENARRPAERTLHLDPVAEIIAP